VFSEIPSAALAVLLRKVVNSVMAPNLAPK
jgi:hypothetical protein